MSDLFSYNPLSHPDETTRQNLRDLSVSDLSQAIKNTLESRFSHVRVRGEISQPRFPGSGHCYLSLKDDKSVLAAVIWRGKLSKLEIIPEDGMDVIAQGRLTSFPGQSKYQLIIENIELAGQGALLKQLEQLRQKLLVEGLFAPERKQSLPFLPTTIGVVTSPTGAVIRDILHRLSDRFPRHVLVWPVRVQGTGSAAEIVAAIKGFSALPTRDDLQRHQYRGDMCDQAIVRPDLIIVARGGGSLEDLWSFNDENVVRAVAACPIPLIAAVGHQTDTTLIDYAADQRAPTPSAAAEMAVPVRRDLLIQCRHLGQRAYTTLKRQRQEYQDRLIAISRGIANPQRLIEEQVQRLDMVEGRAIQAMTYRRNRLRHSLSGLVLLHPSHIVSRSREDLTGLVHRLHQAMTHQISQHQTKLVARHVPAPQLMLQAAWQRLGYLSHPAEICRKNLQQIDQRLLEYHRLLNSYSHKKVLERGYAVIWSQDQCPLTTIVQMRRQQEVIVEMYDGTYQVKIDENDHRHSVSKREDS